MSVTRHKTHVTSHRRDSETVCFPAFILPKVGFYIFKNLCSLTNEYFQYFPSFRSGTFCWTEQKDVILLTEVRFVEPYQLKQGTKEAGQAWTEVASGVNQHEGF